jgi:methionine synthase / methylenetetrahydrofolate reductase (NADH)
MTFLEAIETHPLCGDGAMETLLHERGARADEYLEALCISAPDTIREVHAAYVKSGAQIIRTNTLEANAVQLERHGLSNRVNEINWQAAQLARQAAKKAFVAGSVGPLGISSAEAEQQVIDREECFRTQIGALLEGGVDLIFLEKFRDVDELLVALHVKQSLHHCPAICSFAANENGLLPDGMSLEIAFEKLTRQDAEILGVNWINSPEVALRLVEKLMPSELPLAIYLDVGVSRYLHHRAEDDLSAEVFARLGVALAEQGARIIGGCCGTTPAHIAALSRALVAKANQ